MDLPVNKIICFKQDTEERRRWFKSASFAHPAKMHLALQLYLIEHYTKKGDTILDPMAGSGTILVGCALGRNIICVELEEKFVKMQQDNWQKIKSLGPMLGYQMGKAIILQGDARNLDGLLADNILFSPPYAEAMQERGGTQHKFEREKKIGVHYSHQKNNIGNLPYGEISAVISSPPHGNRLSDDACKDNDPQRMSYRQALAKADAVIASPPYEESMGKKHHSPRADKLAKEKANPTTYTGKADLDESVKRLRNHGRTDSKAGGPYGQSLAHPYSGAADNIGNLKGENYLQAMLQVYRQCHKVLKPEGLMVLVVKNFIRDKKIVRLDLDTIKICEKAGFALIERLKRKLTQQSFWRIIYHQKHPNVEKIEYEDVLIFKRAGGWAAWTI